MKTLILSILVIYTVILAILLTHTILFCNNELDANCDGQVNLVDMSIFLAKAEMVTCNQTDK